MLQWLVPSLCSSDGCTLSGWAGPFLERPVLWAHVAPLHRVFPFSLCHLLRLSMSLPHLKLAPPATPQLGFSFTSIAYRASPVHYRHQLTFLPDFQTANSLRTGSEPSVSFSMTSRPSKHINCTDVK